MKRTIDFAPRVMGADDERFGRTAEDAPTMVRVNLWTEDIYIPVPPPPRQRPVPPPPPRNERIRE